jgi:hypothetical protein
MVNFTTKISNNIRSINSVASKLREIAVKAGYFSPNSKFADDLFGEADALECYADSIQQAVDSDLKEQSHGV